MKYVVLKNSAIKGGFYYEGETIEMIEAAAQKYVDRGLIAPATEAAAPIGAPAPAKQTPNAGLKPANNAPNRKNRGK
ncbi:MAG: hypothetical protein LBO72_08120 [Helicobacteraceae bacterium]|jgi:hypothetical protein|nr:hypothetical protein [Helicobacteraceae bacterium]